MAEVRPKMIKRNFLVYYHPSLNIWWLPELEYIKGAKKGFFNSNEEVMDYIEKNKKELWDVPEVRPEDMPYWINEEYTTEQEWKKFFSNWTDGLSEYLFEKKEPKALRVWIRSAEPIFFIERKESRKESLVDKFFRRVFWLNAILLTCTTGLNAIKNSVNYYSIAPHIFIAFIMHYTKQTDNNKKFFIVLNIIKNTVFGKHKDSIKQLELWDRLILVVLMLALAIALTVSCAFEVPKYLSSGIAIASAPLLSTAVNIAYSGIIISIVICISIYELFSLSGHFRNLPAKRFRWGSPEALAFSLVKSLERQKLALLTPPAPLDLAVHQNSFRQYFLQQVMPEYCKVLLCNIRIQKNKQERALEVGVRYIDEHTFNMRKNNLEEFLSKPTTAA